MRRLPLFVAGLAMIAIAAAACVPQSQPPQEQPPTTTTTATTTPGPPAQVQLTQVNDVPSAITMATRPGDPYLYVGTQTAKIYAVNASQPVTTRNLVLDLNAVTTLASTSGEQGLLGMTFSPDGTKLYVHYSAAGSGNTTVDELTASPAQPAVVTIGSRRPVLTAPGLESNHNGGSLLYGPDDKLYLALGDGGGGNDDYPGYTSHGAGGSGQSTTSLLGKILRIDPADPAPPGGFGPGLSYTIPPDNPFFTTGTTSGGEIWSFGLRNPFRMSFDRTTNDLWIGDVGQGAREEVDFVAVGDATHPYGKLANFGWNRREGLIAGPDPAAPSSASLPLVDPIFDIAHGSGDCAIIGGYVYRGSAIPGLAGEYLYTDNCNASIRALTRSGQTATNRSLGASSSSPSSFGQDNAGELYVLSLSSGLYRVDPV